MDHPAKKIKCETCGLGFVPAKAWQRFCSRTCQKKGASRKVYDRTEVRFDSLADLELVKQAAGVSDASSMNSWIVQTLLKAARRLLRP